MHKIPSGQESQGHFLSMGTMACPVADVYGSTGFTPKQSINLQRIVAIPF
jgi:hypothetical protein